MNKIKDFLRVGLLTIFTIVTSSCSGYLDNPLIDKETGEYIDLLVIDSSVFPVRLTISLTDSASGTAVAVPAVISFTGENNTDIITLSGKKQSEFHTSRGFIELAVDPNVPVSEAEPITFTIHVETAGYPDVSKDYIVDSHGVQEIKLNL
jgi:hypothetical protein